LALTTHPPVQNLPGDAVVALSSKRPRQPTRKLFAVAHQTSANHVFTNLVFANWVSQIRETKNRANGLLREDHYKPDKSSEWSALEKPVAPPPNRALPPAGNF
jgi:hypothetical protein